MASNDNEPRLLVQRLAPIELEMLHGTVAGEALSGIAARLDLGATETRTCWESLMRKLGAECTADVVRVGIMAADEGTA